MTDDELDAMVEAGNQFWHEFSELCHRYINAAPPHLQDEYRAFFGDKTSIFGIKEQIGDADGNPTTAG